jgi:two-component system sensor histidine kinase UhpB
MGRHQLSLYWKVCLTNGVVFLVGTSALAVAPIGVSEQVLVSEAVVLAIGLGVMFGLNALLLRFSLAPVDRVIREMDSVRVPEPGHRLADPGSGAGARLVHSYNAMLDRLEAERSRSNAQALAAQEAERHRIAQELHDEIGQSLTVVLLGLKQLETKAPDQLSEEIDLIRESARTGLDDVRRVARRLRPGVLDDLGLHSALAALCTDLSMINAVHVRRIFGRGIPPMTKETELVIYRVAQEALTNVARHAGPANVTLSLTKIGNNAVLEVIDDGRGQDSIVPGSGILGMRERAALVGAELTVTSAARRGTRVMLSVPIDPGEQSSAEQRS